MAEVTVGKGSANASEKEPRVTVAPNSKVKARPLVAPNTVQDPRRMRRIVAEDAEYNLAKVPALQQLCIDFLVASFKERPVLDDLSSAHRQQILDRLDVDLPLSITANLVDYEPYWKRCSTARWDMCDVAKHGGSWKRLFFERNLAEILENFVPGTTDKKPLAETLALTGKFVYKLHLRQLLPPADAEPEPSGEVEGEEKTLDDIVLPGTSKETASESNASHIEFEPLMRALPEMREFDVTFGVQDCGMNFKWSLFGMTCEDATRLSESVQDSSQVATLVLQRSLINDRRMRIMASNLLDNKTITTLDLSHNAIGDSGARALAKLLNGHSCIEHLDLRDNQIRASGAKALGNALATNGIIKTLNLRLNCVGDAGAKILFDCLMSNTSIESLGLGSNQIGPAAAGKLSEYLEHTKSLLHLDLACNEIGEKGGRLVLEGVEVNQQLVTMDTRLTRIDKDTELAINAILQKNLER